MGELRGGAWAVLDPSINPSKIEIYADPNSRSSVLEPEGTVQIKFRDQSALIARLDPKMREIEKNLSSLAISPEERMQITEKQKIHASKCKVNRLLNNLKIEKIFKIFLIIAALVLKVYISKSGIYRHIAAAAKGTLWSQFCRE